MISLTSPVKTAAHEWSAEVKLGGLCLASIGLFGLPSLPAQAAVTIAVLGLYALPGRVFFYYGLLRLRPLWPFVALLLVWHVALGTGREGAMVALRMANAVALANLVTMTTPLQGMMNVVGRLLSPFARFGVNLRAIELAAAMVIRFTPVLTQKGGALTLAWRARSTKRAGWRIVLPFMVLALDDADHVADALRARGGFETNRERT